MGTVSKDDAAVESSLAGLGSFGAAGMDRRLARFRGRLRDLRDDPAEAARIDALVAEAEREEQEDRDPEAVSASDIIIHLDSGVVNVSRENADPVDVPDVRAERAAAIQRELDLHRDALAAIQADETSRARPRRAWNAMFAPAFGGGVLVAILAAATVAVALHTTVAAMTAVASVLAVTTAAAALLSVWMPWSSVRQLNQRGDARIALEMLSRGTGFEEARQQREQVAMARQFAVEERDAQWAYEERRAQLERERWEMERERSRMERERSLVEIDRQEAGRQRRQELEAKIDVLRILAERGHLDTYDNLIPDLIRRIGGEESPGSDGGGTPPGLARRGGSDVTAPAERA